jgi:hypothetical protein
MCLTPRAGIPSGAIWMMRRRFCHLVSIPPVGAGWRGSKRALAAAAVVLGLSLGPAAPALAIRPFITDDARVVGLRTPQLETWFQGDSGSLQHWVLPAFGPTDWLELTAGGVHGLVTETSGASYSAGGPLFQGKALLRHAVENGLPGVAVVAGLLTPVGSGGLRAPAWAPFAYLALTESLLDAERVLVHANVGVGRSAASGGFQPILTAGVGTQVRVDGGLHAVGEIVRNDAYAGETGPAWQGGGRYIFGDHVQIDATVGRGFAGGDRPLWFSAGLRLVGWPLW